MKPSQLTKKQIGRLSDLKKERLTALPGGQDNNVYEKLQKPVPHLLYFIIRVPFAYEEGKRATDSGVVSKKLIKFFIIFKQP